MPRNGAGTYTLPAGNPVIPNTTISSSVQNTTMSDVASAITQSIAKDGQTVATANLPMGGFKHTNVASAAQANEYATLGQLQTSVAAYLVGVSGGDIITANGSPPVTAYQTGSNYRFKAVATNTTTNVTINIDSVGAIPLRRNDGQPVSIGGITNGEIVEFTYDGTNGIITSTSMALADGGTAGSSRASGIQNLLPTQAGKNGYILSTATINYTTTTRSRASNVATIGVSTTPLPSIGDQVIVSGLPSDYNGTVVVTSTGVNTISYGNAGTDEATTADVLGSIVNYVVEFVPPVLRGYLSGLSLSTAGSSATMSISTGVCADSTNIIAITLQSAISKTTSAWAVGDNQGGLDAGSIANTTWYYFYLIRRPDTGIVDVIFSLSPTSPALPANYTQYRYIGGALTNGSGQWTSFTQVGDEFFWSTPILDKDGAGSATAVLQTISAPRGRKLKAFFNVYLPTAGQSIYLSSPDSADLAPSSSASPLQSLITDGVAGVVLGAQVSCWTNSSAQVRYRNMNGNTIRIVTLGWLDLRGKDI